MTYKPTVSNANNVRLIISERTIDGCEVEVVDCISLGDITVSGRGEPTNIMCYNPLLGKDVVVGKVETTGTQNVTFDLTRLLPVSTLSKLHDRIKNGCNDIYYLMRGLCTNPFNHDEGDVLTVLGEPSYGDYTVSAPIQRKSEDFTEVTEMVAITTNKYIEYGKQSLAIKGELSTDPIVDLVLCDSFSCSAECTTNSKGCNIWFYVQSDGIVGYTTNTFETTFQLVAPIPGVLGTITSINCVSNRLIVTENNAGVGKVYVASISEILFTGLATWTTKTLDINGNVLDGLNSSGKTIGSLHLWLVGDNGSVYQYNSITGNIMPIVAVPSITEDFRFIAIRGETILIGGDNSTLIRSQTGGLSFLQVLVTNGSGSPLPALTTLTTGSILTSNKWVIGTSNDLVLYTSNDGVSYGEQNTYDSGTGTITSIVFDEQGVGFLTRNDGGVGKAYKTLYEFCSAWLELPQSSDIFPANTGLVKSVICDSNPNIVCFAGSNSLVGIIILGVSNYV